jgi:hypothetical protein
MARKVRSLPPNPCAAQANLILTGARLLLQDFPRQNR